MNFQLLNILSTSFDVIVVWVILIFCFRIIKLSHKNFFTVIGMVVIFISKVITLYLDLPTTQIIIDYVIRWTPLIFLILFSNDIKENLGRLGRKSIKINTSLASKNSDHEVFWHKLDYSLKELSSMHIGALITIENNGNIEPDIKVGEVLDCSFSSELVKIIFQPKSSSLHDGAMLIRENKIHSVNNFYPLSTDVNAKFQHGTRHRAALSISNISDSITFVVSEESGSISVAFKGKMMALDSNFHSYDVVVDFLNSDKGDSYE